MTEGFSEFIIHNYKSGGIKPAVCFSLWLVLSERVFIDKEITLLYDKNKGVLQYEVIYKTKSFFMERQILC